MRTDRLAGQRQLPERGRMVLAQGAHRHLIVVNLSGSRSQTRVRLPWGDLAGRSCRLSDRLQMTVYDRAGDELQESGLYVELEPWGYHVFKVSIGT